MATGGVLPTLIYVGFRHFKCDGLCSTVLQFSLWGVAVTVPANAGHRTRNVAIFRCWRWGRDEGRPHFQDA